MNSVIIALASGALGAHATVPPRLSVGLVGVAIATAVDARARREKDIKRISISLDAYQ